MDKNFFGTIFPGEKAPPERQEPHISKEGLERVAQELQSERQEEGGMYETIQLPEDSEKQKFLHNKLVEYKARLAGQRARHPYTPPEAFTDTHYKIALLEALLGRGVVDPNFIAESLRMRDGSIDESSFTNAVNVMTHYIEEPGPETQEQSSPFEAVLTFEDLFSKIDEQGTIESDGKVYTPDELKRAIQFVREHDGDINAVTRAFGLRDKVVELLRGR